MHAVEPLYSGVGPYAVHMEPLYKGLVRASLQGTGQGLSTRDRSGVGPYAVHVEPLYKRHVRASLQGTSQGLSTRDRSGPFYTGQVRASLHGTSQGLSTRDKSGPLYRASLQGTGQSPLVSPDYQSLLSFFVSSSYDNNKSAV